MKAIILAGGKGTRLKPLTNTVPKALVPIGDSTLLEKVLDSLPDTVDTVIITTKYLGDVIKNKIGSEYNKKVILYATQPEHSDGTWSALYCAKDYITQGEIFMVMNCDDIFNKAELTAISNPLLIGMGVTTTVMPAKYHGIEISKDEYVCDLKRHIATDKESLVKDTFSNGLYILDSNIFSFDPVALTDGELGLPQTLLANIGRYPLFAHNLIHWQPCNSFEDLHKITNE